MRLNIPDKGFVIRRSQQGIRPVALIQHQLLIIRTVVEQKNTVLYRYLTHSKVGAHPVQSLSFPLYGKQHIKQARPFRRPAQLLEEITLFERIRRIQWNGKRSRPAEGVMRKADNLPPVECDNGFQRATGSLAEGVVEANRPLVKQRRNDAVLQIKRLHGFQPYALPDSRCSVIKDTAGFFLPILFSTRHFQVKRVVLHLHFNHEAFL